MKAKRKILTAVTISAFLALGGAVHAQDTGGSTDRTNTTGKKPGKITKAHKGGKKGHKGGKKGHKGGKKATKSTTPSTPPPK
jgi:hypothetical protein